MKEKSDKINKRETFYGQKSMEQLLRRKFVRTAMIAVTVLLLILVGGINIFNAISTVRHSRQTLDVVLRMKSQPDDLPELGPRDDIPVTEDNPAPEEGPGNFDFRKRDERDMVFSSPHFTVTLDTQGEVLNADVTHIGSLSENNATAMALSAKEKGESDGYMGRFRFASQTNKDNGEVTYAFVDMTSQIDAMLQVLTASFAVAAVCWIGTLFLVQILSKAAIAPIAENMEKQKQFVTDAGHELKTPLAIIQANADALELFQGENKWTGNIKQQTVRMDGLIKNMLVLARTDEGSIKQNVTTFSISELADSILNSFEESMRSGNLQLHREIDTEVMMTADREQITQVLTILMDNARKYAKENTKVSVKLTREGKHIVLKTENICAQKPTANAEQLFDRFYRGDEARTQKSGGYGIGLSVARSLVQANKGSIKAHIENEGESKDATICFIVQF